MTQSLTIVNTSNWDGEDYLINQDGYGPLAVTLKPGESEVVYPKEGYRLTVTPVTSLPAAEPFKMNGRHMMPSALQLGSSKC